MFLGEMTGDAELPMIPLTLIGGLIVRAFRAREGREFGSLFPGKAFALGKLTYPGQFENIDKKPDISQDDMRGMWK